MTVVRPNSIAGINSITVQTGQALNIHDASGNLIRSLTNSSGISTFASINVTQGSGDLIVGISTLVVDNSAGKIGIGTVPARTLQVFAATPQVNLKSAAGGNCELQFGDTGDEVRANIIYNSSDNYLGFNGYNNTERLRITSAGLVGINSTIPRSKLHVANGSSHYNPGNPTGLGAGAVACLESSSDVALQFLSSTTTDNFIYFGDTSSATTGSIQYDHNVNALLFNVNGGSERLKITNAGDILLGTDQACIGCNTADGADNRSFSLCGGSDASQGRGALVGLFGNEHSSPGVLALRAGNPGGSSGGHIEFSAGGSIRHYINKHGYIGLNMSPEAWHTNNQMVVQLSGSGGGMNIFTRASNSFLTSNFRYKANDAGVFQASSNYALMYQLEAANGSFKWHTSTAATTSGGSSASMKTRMVLEQDGSLVVGDRVGLTSPSTNQPIAFHSARVNPDGGSAGIATGVRCNLYVGSNSGWASGDGGVLGLGGSGSGTAGQERMWAYVHGRRQSGNGWEYGGTIDLGTADWSGSTTSKKMRIWSQGQCEYYPSDNTAYSLKYGSDVRLRFTHNSGNGNLTINNPSSGACVFDTSSDYRLKKDETAISNALTTVKALKPYQYTWKHSNELGQGFFAHEAQAVLPDIGVVSGTKDGAYTEDDTEKGQWKKDDPIYQGIDYSKLVPLLTAALQELEARVASLESS